MCAPVLGILGAVVSAAGSLMQGQQQAALAEAQAKAYEQQAIADSQAAQFEASQERRKQDLLLANARAQTGASGVAVKGSPTAVMVANAGQGELDLAAIRYGSQLRQNNLRSQADISRFQGKQAKTAGFINAATSFTSGISQLYDPNKAVKMNRNPFAAPGLY